MNINRKFKTREISVVSREWKQLTSLVFIS